MRLPSILMAVSALTLLASDSALAAVADASEAAKVSTMASPSFDGQAVSHSAKRSLRGPESLDEDDEERWLGAKLFDPAKLKRAMDDPKYAETLMMRWKRHGFDIEATKTKLNASPYAKNEKLNEIYHNYAAWLDTHFSRLEGVKPTGGDDLFNKAKIDQALKDSNYAKSLFREWKTHNHEYTDVLKKLEAMGLKEGDGVLHRLYVRYRMWLNVHNPREQALTLAKKDLLFEESMLLKARGDVEYAQDLFWAWKKRGFTVNEVTKKLDNTLGNVDNRLLNGYKSWVNMHFPVKEKTIRS